MTPRYYGKASKEFWHRISKLKKHHGEMYSLGCVLQSVEQFVLNTLATAEFRENRRRAKRSAKRKAAVPHDRRRF